MIVYIDADTFPPGNRDFKVILAIFALKAAVFNADQFFFHGQLLLLEKERQRYTALRADSLCTEDTKAVILAKHQPDPAVDVA